MTINELLGRPVASIDDVMEVLRAPPKFLGIGVSSQSAQICVHHLWTNLQRQLGAMSPELAAELDALGTLSPADILSLHGSRPSYLKAFLTLAKGNPQ